MFPGVYLFFLFLLQNVDCGYSLECLVEEVLTCTHNLSFEQKYENYQKFSTEHFQFLQLKKNLYISIILHGCFCNLMAKFIKLSTQTRNESMLLLLLFISVTEFSRVK